MKNQLLKFPFPSFSVSVIQQRHTPCTETVSEDELLQSGSDEEEVVVLGGEGMSPEDLRKAEAAFDAALVGWRLVVVELFTGVNRVAHMPCC